MILFSRMLNYFSWFVIVCLTIMTLHGIKEDKKIQDHQTSYFEAMSAEQVKETSIMCKSVETYDE